jgi:TRAP-type C4-dicarboxylate transport system substrate-binding protein
MLRKSLVLLFCVLFLFTLAKATVAAEKIVLRAVTPWPQNVVEHDVFFMFIDEVHKKLGDRVEIKYLGGADVIPMFSQFEMLGKGTYDIGHLVGNYAKNFLPVAETLHLSRIKPWEERDNAVYDILRNRFEKEMNIFYLGKIGAGENYRYHLYANFEVKTLADFKGKTFRVAPVYVPLLNALGAGSVSMPSGEVYTALERGVVDGFGWPNLAIIDMAFFEVTKYRIDPGFYPVGIGVFLNLDKWNSLPADLREEIENIAISMERKAYDYYSKKVKEENEQVLQKGLKAIELPPDEASKYLTIAFDEGWKSAIEADPEYGPILKELTTPK